MTSVAEGEDVREELRRAEEHVSQLRAGNARLERRLLKPGMRGWTVACVMATALSGPVGFLVAHRAASHRGAQERAAAASEHAYEMDRARASLQSCRDTRERTTSELVTCERDRAQRLADEDRREAHPARPCRCQAGDPLCSCL